MELFCASMVIFMVSVPAWYQSISPVVIESVIVIMAVGMWAMIAAMIADQISNDPADGWFRFTWFIGIAFMPVVSGCGDSIFWSFIAIMTASTVRAIRNAVNRRLKLARVREAYTEFDKIALPIEKCSLCGEFVAASDDMECPECGYYIGNESDWK